MDGTRELVDPDRFGVALAVLTGLGAVAAVGLALAARKGAPGLRKAAILAAALVSAYPLWVVYNSIEDSLGLDSVAALLINVVLFLAAGTAGGFLARRSWPREDLDFTTETRRHGERVERG